MSHEIPTPTAPVAPIKSTVHRYSCDQLGVCQRRHPSCTGCAPFVSSQAAHPFAPGAIEQEPSSLLGDKSQRRYLVKYAVASAALVITVVLVSGLIGYWMGQ